MLLILLLHLQLLQTTGNDHKSATLSVLRNLTGILIIKKFYLHKVYVPALRYKSITSRSTDSLKPAGWRLSRSFIMVQLGYCKKVTPLHNSDPIPYLTDLLRGGNVVRFSGGESLRKAEKICGKVKGFALVPGLDFITAQQSITRCNKSQGSEAPICQRNSNKLRPQIPLTDTVRA